VGRHRDPLAEMIEDIGDVRLVIIDPISAYCGSADTHKTSDVRQALAPMQQLAADRDVAMLAISHLNKAAGGDPMSRITGSGAYVAVARAAFLVAEDPSDDGKRRRILAPLKNNLGDDKTGFAFSIESVALVEWLAAS
jgi:putative DNA primase/helicase